MIFDFAAQPATFIARPNRYVVHAQLASGEVTAPIPDASPSCFCPACACM